MVDMTKDEILAALQIGETGAFDIDHGRRSPQTVVRYRYQAHCLMRRAGTAGKPGTIWQAIDFLFEISPTLRHSTCRQYRAALMQILRDLHQLGRLEMRRAAASLHRLGIFGAEPLPHGSSAMPPRCGAGRRRGLDADAHKNTVFRLRALKTPQATVLANLLVVGDLVGLRPWEWPTSEVREGWLIVVSAKMNERMGRGLTHCRQLDLEPLGRFWVDFVSQICNWLRLELERYGSSEKVMQRYAQLLRIYRTDSRMTLRSMRHQFRKNAKVAGWTIEEIAVALNHASAESQRAYGRGARGRRGLILPAIDRSLIPAVRIGRSPPQFRRMFADDEFRHKLPDPMGP